MEDVKFKNICLILIIINALAAFLLVGMPKDYTSRHHFYGLNVSYNKDHSFYIVKDDMALTDTNGNKVTVPAGTQVDGYNYDKLNRKIDDTLNGRSETAGDTSKDIITIRIEPHGPNIELPASELDDTEKFEDVTEKVRQERDEAWAKAQEEGDRKYNEHLLQQRLWFFFPHLYIMNYVAGLLFGLISLSIMLLLYRRRHYKGLTLLVSLFCILKVTGIVYFYLNPSFCH